MRFNLDEDELIRVYEEFSGLPKSIEDRNWRERLYKAYINDSYGWPIRKKMMDAEEEKERLRLLELIKDAIEL